jgi:hypothetical protein
LAFLSPVSEEFAPGSGLAVLSGQRLPFTGPWPGPCAGHGVIAITRYIVKPPKIDLRGVLVAVLIGVTVPGPPT